METNKELMRAEFEAWHLKRFGYKAVLIPEMGNNYKTHTARVAWDAWQASLSQRSEAVPTILKPGISHEKCANAFAESLDGYSYAKHIRDFAREWFQTGWFSLSEAIRSELEQPTPAQGDAVPVGYSFKRVEGRGWYVDSPKHGRWIAFDGTPAADLVAAIATSQSSADAVGMTSIGRIVYDQLAECEWDIHPIGDYPNCWEKFGNGALVYAIAAQGGKGGSHAV